MRYTRLGNTGLQVSRICLGMMTYGSKKWRDWVLEEEESLPAIAKAMEQGINFLDTADMYSLGVSEEITGKAVREFASSRHDMVIATKIYQPMSEKLNDRGLSRKHIMNGVENSLRRLQTDYIDLYQIHRFDYNTPIEETLEALNDLVRSGKVRYLGASSMYAWQLSEMLHTAKVNGWSRFVSMQNHYNLVYREEEREMIPLCQHHGLGVVPWSPLARGFLAGNRTREDKGETVRSKSDDIAHRLYYQDSDFDVSDAVKAVASQRGVPNAQVALAWLLSRPAVTAPIVGASKPHHLSDAIAALDLVLSPGEIEQIEKPYRPHAVLGHS